MWIKYLHLACVIFSLSGFILRGIWMLQGSNKLHQPWVKITPHCIDSLLLASAIAMAVQWQLSPLEHTWLAAKIAALFIYIALGSLALKRGKTLKIRRLAFGAALLTFAYIVGVAITKSPLLSHLF